MSRNQGRGAGHHGAKEERAIGEVSHPGLQPTEELEQQDGCRSQEGHVVQQEAHNSMAQQKRYPLHFNEV